MAGATANSVLQVRRACSTSLGTYNTFGELWGIASIGTISLKARENVQFDASTTDRISAFGETFYRSAMGVSRFTIFQSLSDFTLTFSNSKLASPPPTTLGYTDRVTFCFFAAGLPPQSDTLQSGYEGIADGLYQSASGAQRLNGSPASITMNVAARTGTLRIDLKGYPSVIPQFDGQAPSNIGAVTANLAFAGTQITATGVNGPAGFTGTMAGQLAGNDGAILVYELKDSAGNIIWGSVAFDDAACSGCWDY